MSVSHSKVSLLTDGADSNVVRPSDWNADHVLDVEVNAQTGTSYTLQASDNGKVVTLSNGSAIALTVPTALGTGFSCLLVQLGAGAVTVSAGASATVNSRGALVALNGQYAVASLIPTATANSYILAGDLA